MTMGWRELRAWLEVMRRQHEVDAGRTRPDPHRWNEQSRQNFADLDEQRRKLRGR